MPDPLLLTARFEEDFERAKAFARRLGGILSYDGPCVFLECCGCQGQPMLARINCLGYPLEPPDVEFLKPGDGKQIGLASSTDQRDWPMHVPIIPRDNRLHLCLAGTRSFRLLHGNAGQIPTLSQLVGTLILCCRGESPLVRSK